MFAIGHFAIGYLTGKAAASKLKVQLNMPLLLTASIIPDIDLLLRFLYHRGPTHSLITMIALTVPFLIYYRKTAVPYFVALLSHSLIGDFITGGAQLFWPILPEWYRTGTLSINVASSTDAYLEVGLFLVSLAVMFKTGDLRKIISDKPKIGLLIPFGAVLGPLLLRCLKAVLSHFLLAEHGPENHLPDLLIIPSLFYIAIFVYAIAVGKIPKKIAHSQFQSHQSLASQLEAIHIDRRNAAR